MDTEETNTLRLLFELYRRCRDSEERYRIASAEERDSDLRFLFSSYRRQRARFARQLQELLCAETDEQAENNAVSLPENERSNRQLLEEFVRCEETLLQDYRKALAAKLSEPVRVLVEAQCREIETARGKMEKLRRLERAG